MAAGLHGSARRTPRVRAELQAAQASTRTLLAMESHVAKEVDVSEADIDRVEKGVWSGKPRTEVFPRLGGLGIQIAGEGATITVRFTKGDGAPVRFIAADDPAKAAAVREIDLQKRFYMPATRLAELLKLPLPKSHAPRQQLGIDKDKDCMHVFTFGNSKHPRFSDIALKPMREALAAKAPALSPVQAQTAPLNMIVAA